MKKDKVYRYECPFTQASLYEKLQEMSMRCSVGDYLIEKKEDGKIYISVERNGQSEYWFVGNLIEENDKISIEGQIVCNSNEKADKTTFGQRVRDTVVTLVLSPAFVCLWVAVNAVRISGRMLFRSKKPTVREKKLDDIMVNQLSCKKVA